MVAQRDACCIDFDRLSAGYFAYDAVRLTYRSELASLAGNSPDLALTLTISVLTSIGRLLTLVFHENV